MSIRVKLHGTVYWFLGDTLDDDHAIAPLHHCDDMGNPQTLSEDSFAHYFAGDGIYRYREKIAECSEMQVLDLDGEIALPKLEP